MKYEGGYIQNTFLKRLFKGIQSLQQTQITLSLQPGGVHLSYFKLR